MSRFIVLPSRVLEDTRLSSATHLRVLMYLGLRADRNGWCFPSRKDIAAKVGGITPARVSQCMRDLAAWGYVEIHAQARDSDGGQTSNAYRILFDIGEPVDDEKEVLTPVSETNPPISEANPPVSAANSPKKRKTPVSRANPPVSPAKRGSKSHSVIRGGKSLAFTPVVNDPSNDPSIKSSSSNAREAAAVDNSEKAAAAASKKKGKDELALLALLASLPRCPIDGERDRVHVLEWVGRSVTHDQMREAHRRAALARDRDDCDLPINAGFLSRFVLEVLTARSTAPGATTDGPWYESPEGVDAKGAEHSVRERKPSEDWRVYRVHVAKAANDARAAEFILADAIRFNSADLYQFARTTLGDALMPTDDYAS